ncbi:MAG: FtsX-like permease family protein [Bdellovibrionota bacterium]|nr:FtsX-like permease family protein [Bdellovibrionota bacterium]
MIALRLAWRELKNNYRYWLFFSLNLIVGLIGFTFILLFRDNIADSLSQRSTQLLSSDIAISGRRDITGDEEKKVMSLMSSYQTDYTRLVSLYSMGKADNEKSRLLFVKFITGKYPLQGNIEIDTLGSVDQKKIESLNSKPYVWISPEVAHQFKLENGSLLKIGKVQFEVQGIIETDTTSSMRGFSLAPKVYVGQNFLKQTELVSFGTVAWRSRFFNLKDPLKATELKEELEKIITDPAIDVRTPENASEQLSRVIGYLSDFLGLIGVVALLMSAIGIFYLFQSYIFERLKHIGILKSLGVTNGNILLNFALVITVVGILSSGATLILAKLLLPLGMEYLKEFYKGEFNDGLTWQVSIIVLCLGLIVNLFTCLPIIIVLLKQKTISLLSSELRTKPNILLYVPGAVFLWGLSVWQARSLIIGTVFFVALLVVFLIVTLALPFILKSISKKLIGKPISRPGGLWLGYALRLISRNRYTTLLLVLSLSIGITLISVIGQLDKSLKQELTSSKEPKPSLFLFDIQDEQVGELVEFAKNNDIPMADPTPMVRARLIKKNGEEVKRQDKKEGFTTREEEQSRRFNNRGVNLSYAKGLNPSEKLVEGKEFSGVYSGEGLAEVSLEKRYAQRIGVKIGDTLTYEVLGVEVQAIVVNTRQVNWTSFRPNFFIVFQPGVLEIAPKTFLAIVKKIDFEKQLLIQDLLVDKFSNISIINVTELVTKILTLFKAMAWAIGIMSLCCIVVGIFVLYSILQNQLLKKKNEMALQKIMGFEGRSIFGITLVEYSLTCIVALVIGTTMGTIVAYTVSQIFLDGVFVFNYEFVIGLNIVLYILTVLTIAVTYRIHHSQNIKSLLSD